MSQARTARSSWWSATIAGMASYLDGAITVGTGSALVLYQDDFGLSGNQIGQLNALLTVCFAIGALTGGRLGDRLGRRRVFSATMILLVIGAVLMSFAINPAMLYAGVILLGAGAGADLPVSLAMIAETAPEGKVGKMITYSQYLWLIGIVAVLVIGSVFGGLGTLGGRIYNIHVLVIAALVLIFRMGLPESKTWTETQNIALNAGAKPQQATLRDLFSSRFRWPLIATALFYVLLMIALNTNGQFSSYVWVEAAGSTVQIASLFSLVGLAVSFIGTGIMMRIVDTKWRKIAFVIATIVNVGSFAVVAIFGAHVWSLVALGVLFSLGGAIAGEPMYKVWSQELFPTQFRATAQGMTMFAARLVAALVALVTPALIAWNVNGFYWVLAGVTLLSCLVGIFWIFRIPAADDSEVDAAPVEVRA
ncbi:MFS transporter [Microbacterium sorbitolivorans]|nr:MFS transporter [Microbacterium sorbitolivorans]GGF36423.1 MFS transporter [Microbacterium sorbitolivorans]